MATDMSLRLGGIEEDILHRTIALLKMAQLPTKPPQVFPLAGPSVHLCLYAGTVERHSGKCLSYTQLYMCCGGLICVRVVIS